MEESLWAEIKRREKRQTDGEIDKTEFQHIIPSPFVPENVTLNFFIFFFFQSDSQQAYD